MTDQSLKLTNIAYTWTIENFYNHCDMAPGARINSPEITTFNHGNGITTTSNKWHLWVYPNNIKEAIPKYQGTTYVLLSLYLKYAPNNKAFVRITKLTMNGISKECDSNATGRAFVMPCGNFLNSYFKKIEVFNEKNVQFSNGNLTIVIEMSFVPEEALALSLLKSPETVLSENLHSLFESNKFCDITFIVGEKKFAANKAILSARSPVFAAMFESDMKEKNENQVNIDDAEPHIFKEMLQFIYSSKVTNIQEIAMNLIKLADKYQLDNLKSLCEDAIIECVNVQNASDSLITADLYSPTALKPRVLIYIEKHVEELMNTKKFKSLETSHPQLMIAIYQLWVNQLKNSALDKGNKRLKQ